jgi:hypothetical protein
LLPVTIPADSEILASWRQWYAEVPPVGFLLREAYSDRWLRIHSLPESKRYPASGFDYAELLRRHNAVAEDVLGVAEPCAILLLHACEGRGVHAVGRKAGLTASSLSRLAELPLEFFDEVQGVFTARMCIFGLRTIWKGGGFDRFIIEVGEDRSHGLVVNLESGRVYAPYDGGADLFYLSEDERDRARDRFGNWISSREDGL